MIERSRRPLARAFTLIELLVVIAIIAVIAALSVPVMSKAYGVAAETRCVSNLRSLGQATAAYAADARQKFPAAYRLGGRDAVWYANLAGARGSSSDPRNVPAADRALHRYLDGSTDVAVCPLDRGVVDYAEPSVGDRWGTSYTLINNDTDRFGDRVERNGIWSLEGFGLLDVSSPSTKAVMTDFIQLRTLADGERNAWHGEKDGHLRSGMAFVDGGAKMLRLKVEPPTPRQSVVVRSRGAIETMAKTDL